MVRRPVPRADNTGVLLLHHRSARGEEGPLPVAAADEEAGEEDEGPGLSFGRHGDSSRSSTRMEGDRMCGRVCGGMWCGVMMGKAL